MTLYAASNSNTVIEPFIIVVLCSLIFAFSMIDVWTDIVFGPDPQTK
jgi:hypothetical protein